MIGLNMSSARPKLGATMVGGNLRRRFSTTRRLTRRQYREQSRRARRAFRRVLAAGVGAETGVVHAPAGELYVVFSTHLAADPHRQALVFETDTGSTAEWSYAELEQEVLALAAGLGELGLEQGDRFIVCLENHPELIRSLLAASLMGLIVVPSDPRLTERELRHQVAVAEPRLVIGASTASPAAIVAAEIGVRFLEARPPLEGPVVCGAEPCQPARARDDVVELLFTSGTTSAPKAVMLTNASLMHGARSLARGARYRPADVPLIALPLYHAGAQIHQLLPTFMLGGTAVVLERFSPSLFFTQARRHRATTSAQYAATLRLLLRRGDERDARASLLRHVTFAQSLTPTEYAEWEHRFGIPLQQLWGMTETSGLPLMSPLDGDRRLEAMGVPQQEFYEVELRRSNVTEVAVHEAGEIVIRAKPGKNVMLGYLRNPEATAETIRDGWIRTGDTAYRDEDGFFHFVGRGRDLIRRAGQNFSAVEIEHVLLEHPAITDAAVVGIPDRLGDQKVAAFVVAVGDLSVADVRDHCRLNLASFKRPDVVRLVDSLPRTAVGKIQKHLLDANT